MSSGRGGDILPRRLVVQRKHRLMIFVQGQPEPPQFEEKVRLPGRAFIEQVPKPSTKQWNFSVLLAKRVERATRCIWGSMCLHLSLDCPSYGSRYC